MERDFKAAFDDRTMTEQGTTYENPTFFRDNPSYDTVRRGEPQLEGDRKKQCRVSDRCISVSALFVAAIALVVAVAFATVLIQKSDCSCNEGASTHVTVQVHSIHYSFS